MSRTLGDYLLGEVVEEDTHTITYRGSKGGDERPLLIKALKPGLRPTRQLRQQLEAERALLLDLAHPSLPTVLGRFRSKHSMALLFVDCGGYRLSKVLRQAVVVDAGGAAAIALEVAEVLSAVHRRRRVHGHVKPSLIEVTGAGQIVVHGLRARDADFEQPLETPDELTPEQLLGGPPEPHTDVFLVGALLYRMLAGRGPFEGGDEEGVGQRVRSHMPAPLPNRSPPISDGLERIVRRCLSKRPGDRFPDMSSLVSALEADLRNWSALPRDVLITRVLDSAGLADALPLPAQYNARPPLKRAWVRWQRPLAAAGLLVVVAGLGLMAWRLSQPDQSRGAAGPRGIVDRPGYVRVLAQPWAEIYVDGKLADVTPAARPLEVAPGRHTFLFRHPNAPEQTRTIELIAGQTILLDVQMQVVRPPASASASASATATAAPGSAAGMPPGLGARPAPVPEPR